MLQASQASLEAKPSEQEHILWFPKIRGTFLGVRKKRIQVHWGLYKGPLSRETTIFSQLRVGRQLNMGGTAKHLKIGRLKSVLPENLLIRQPSDLAFGSRFVYNCRSACFSEINIVPRTAPSTQCQQKKVTSLHVLGRWFIRMKCLAAFHAKPQATPYRQ